MSCCRLWTLSLCLFLIFPGLFFFPWVALSVLVTHCLELGNVYVSLEFAGRGKGRVDKAKFVCDCSARLHRCGWPITLKSPVGRGGGAGGQVSLWEPESCWGVLLTAESEEGEVLFSPCESKTASQVLLDQVFAPAISSWGPENRKWKEMQDIEGFGAFCVYILFARKNWLWGRFHNKTK